MAVPYDDPESHTRYCRGARSVESLRAVVVHVLTGLALYTGIYFEEACITRQLSLVGRRAKPGLMVRDVDNELRLALFPYLASIIS